MAIVLALRLLPSGAARPVKLDVRGLALVCAGVATVTYGLSEAGSNGGFGTARTLTLLGIGLLLLALYVVHALARRDPR